ncbi:MAG: hypothetical protein ACYC1C_04415 [Chloroflexota bacterium]|nr:hypothetical protein [Dehalococcoidales bacterium]
MDQHVRKRTYQVAAYYHKGSVRHSAMVDADSAEMAAVLAVLKGLVPLTVLPDGAGRQPVFWSYEIMPEYWQLRPFATYAAGPNCVCVVLDCGGAHLSPLQVLVREAEADEVATG